MASNKPEAMEESEGFAMDAKSEAAERSRRWEVKGILRRARSGAKGVWGWKPGRAVGDRLPRAQWSVTGLV